jgi:hypothetical protein
LSVENINFTKEESFLFNVKENKVIRGLLSVSRSATVVQLSFWGRMGRRSYHFMKNLQLNYTLPVMLLCQPQNKGLSGSALLSMQTPQNLGLATESK